ncbi:hypothetical protein [Myxococcus sp. AB056]|uniref:hypothetical protein n=1 Tax=Myxococcus sp. AB056 TaxID=2562792 RepID=UPI001146BC95|nr:hypothetical protein [Myxococcus sp. AB056]
MTDPSPKKSGQIKEKIGEWLNSEGYPLEFKTARAFREAGFHIRQGMHARDNQGTAREIDVLAEYTLRTNPGFVRISHTIECKWSNDKPWVVFTSEDAQVASSACINQTMANPLGRAILWCLAGDTTLKNSSIFETPDRPGFAGRQCFSKQDLFYNAMQSIITSSTTLMDNFNHPIHRRNKGFPDAAWIILPCIVIEGELFEVFQAEGADGLEIQPADRIRIHWRGAEARSHITHVDIIRASHLPTFAKQRRAEVDKITNTICISKQNIEECIRESSLDKLNITEGARGTLGLPPLLQEVKERTKKEPK